MQLKVIFLEGNEVGNTPLTEAHSPRPPLLHFITRKQEEWFGSYLQEIAFEEIALLGQSIKAMVEPHCLLGQSPDSQLALDPTPASRQERRKVSHGGPAALGGLAAYDSLRDLHLHHTGMSVCTVGCWLLSRMMAALPNGVHPISGRYGIGSGPKEYAARSSWVSFYLFSCVCALSSCTPTKQEGQYCPFSTEAV
ncbi:uncharacterized [Tachysurus ichikawai]